MRAWTHSAHEPAPKAPNRRAGVPCNQAGVAFKLLRNTIQHSTACAHNDLLCVGLTKTASVGHLTGAPLNIQLCRFVAFAPCNIQFFGCAQKSFGFPSRPVASTK